jgi:hypothetical protein
MTVDEFHIEQVKLQLIVKCVYLSLQLNVILETFLQSWKYQTWEEFYRVGYNAVIILFLPPIGSLGCVGRTNGKRRFILSYGRANVN